MCFDACFAVSLLHFARSSSGHFIWWVIFSILLFSFFLSFRRSLGNHPSSLDSREVLHPARVHKLKPYQISNSATPKSATVIGFTSCFCRGWLTSYDLHVENISALLLAIQREEAVNRMTELTLK